MNNVKKEIAGLVRFIQDEVKGAGRESCIVGVSGGIDSAVILALCNLAFPNNVYGLSLPSDVANKDLGTVIVEGGNKGNSSMVRAQELCTKFSIPLQVVQLEKPKYLEGMSGLAVGNFMARQRMAILYLYAEKHKGMVIGTDNLTENYIGYFTKYGDGGVDINPIGEYFKSEVVELAKELGVPDSIINAKPSAELWEGQTDEGELEMTYSDMDTFIPIAMEFDRFLINQTATTETKDTPFADIVAMFDKTLIGIPQRELHIINKLIFMHHNTEHKRVIPKEYHRGH